MSTFTQESEQQRISINSRTSYYVHNRDFIEKEGRKAFKSFTEDKREFLNDFLTFIESSVRYSLPKQEYMEKNLIMVKFALNFLKRNSDRYIDNLFRRIHILENQLNPKHGAEEPELLKFHENGEWSLINYFDNNVKLWRDTIIHAYNTDNEFKDSVIGEHTSDNIIRSFFQNKKNNLGLEMTYGQIYFLKNITERLEYSKSIVKGTSDSGKNLEDEFILYLKKYHQGNLITSFPDNITELSKTNGNIVDFSDFGSVVDMMGIDLALLVNGKWYPVQVKPTQREALLKIPQGGISVFPIFNNIKNENEFFVFKDKVNAANKFSTTLDF